MTPRQARYVLTAAIFAYSGLASAKLPPPTEEAKSLAAQAAAKAAWSDKVSLYKTCKAMDRTAEAYRNNLKTAGKDAPNPMATPPCADPGPYAASAAPTPATSKPLEASEAHSPPGNATSPPSTSVPAAQMPKVGSN